MAIEHCAFRCDIQALTHLLPGTRGAPRGRGISHPPCFLWFFPSCGKTRLGGGRGGGGVCTLLSSGLSSAIAGAWELRNSLQGKKDQEAASSLQDPTSHSRDHRLESRADFALPASKQGLEPMSKPGEHHEPSQHSIGPLKKL